MAYSNQEVARLVAEVTGRPVEIAPVTDEELAQILQRAGIPEPLAKTLASGDAHTRAGHAAETNDLIEKLARRKPKTLREFLESSKVVLLAPPSY